MTTAACRAAELSYNVIGALSGGSVSCGYVTVEMEFANALLTPVCKMRGAPVCRASGSAGTLEDGLHNCRPPTLAASPIPPAPTRAVCCCNFAKSGCVLYGGQGETNCDVDVGMRSGTAPMLLVRLTVMLLRQPIPDGAMPCDARAVLCDGTDRPLSK